MSQEEQISELKAKIKQWETDFNKNNSKKPDKADIKTAPDEIKEAYRKYWKMKNNIGASKISNCSQIIEMKLQKDDVWSANLNKVNKQLELKSKSAVVENYCERMKRKIGIKNPNMNLRPLSRQPSEKSNITNEISLDDLECQDEVNERKEESSISFDIKVKKLPTKVENANNTVQKFKSVNILSPVVNGNSKKLYFKQNVDHKWLERCKLDLEDNVTDSCVIKKNASELDVENRLDSQSCYNNSLDNNAGIPFLVKQKDDDYLEHDAAEMISTSQSKSAKTPNKLSKKQSTDQIEYNLSQQSSEQQCKLSEKIPNTGEKVTGTDIFSFNEATSPERTSSSKHQLSQKQGNVESASPLKGHQNQRVFSSPSENQKLKTEPDFLENNESGDKDEKRGGIKRKLDQNWVKKSNKTAHLQKKIAAGTLNENYVRVNIKKKKFSRGHKSVNIRKLKWQKWKQLRKQSDNDSSTPISRSTCFKCGQVGHWARSCTAQSKEKAFSEEEEYDEPALPTLEEAALLAEKKMSDALKTAVVKMYEDASTTTHGSLEENFESSESPISQDNRFSERTIKPLYDPLPDGNVIKTPDEVFEALAELGFESFRRGQEVAVMRVLSGLSTLLVLPTGSGKSLCYQLPAYMFAKQNRCLALVISPLVSLMEDQVTGLSSSLHAVCLHSGLTEVQKKKSLSEISDGTAQILLVSPEAIIGSNAYGSGMLPADLPPISFACIDEAHCLSQWSHNFRPSYLQLYKALTEKLGVKCILGLTATATNVTAKDIITHLGLELTEESIVGHTNIPQNLHLSVSRDKDKDKALIQLLSGDRFRTCASIIIYCIRRVETERLAALIRTTMQDEIIPSEEQQSTKKAKKSKKRCFVWTVEAYHAGLTAPRRRSIQKQFMSGKLRVIVATVAFGMGVDKSDVRAIIHYNMPKTFESYVQEIGRAGRDGLDAHCHLFLDDKCKDLYELRRHIYANGTDRHALRKLLQRVFQPCKCSKLSDDSSKVKNVESEAKFSVQCPKHEIAFSINDTVQELDMKEENILTLLCYLELYSNKWLEIQPSTYSTCTIRCYGGPKQMHSIACKSPIVATAIALDERRGKKFEKTSHYQFPVVEVASFMGLKSSAVKRELKGLEWNEQRRKTGVLVEFSDLAFHVLAPGNLSEDELDSILDYLQKKVTTSEKQELANLNSLFSVFQKYSSAHYWSCCDEANLEQSQKIKEAVNTYFTRNEIPLDDVIDSTFTENEPPEDMLLYARSEIRDLICTHRDQEFSGRAIARILHGISSPCYPSEIWGKVRKFWRSFLHIDFNLLLKVANEELKTYR